MTAQLLPASVAALCAAILLALVRHITTRPSPLALPQDEKQSYTYPTEKTAVTTSCDVERGETPPLTVSAVSDIKVGMDIIDEVWPPVERETDEPAPTLGAALPDVALVWGMDYSFDARPPMSAVDRRPLMAYSHIASALGVDEPEPVIRRSDGASLGSTLSASSATDTRPMRSRSLIGGIVSDWNSLSQGEQQAWATLSESRAARSRTSHSRTRQFDS